MGSIGIINHEVTKTYIPIRINNAGYVRSDRERKIENFDQGYRSSTNHRSIINRSNAREETATSMLRSTKSARPQHFLLNEAIE